MKTDNRYKSAKGGNGMLNKEKSKQVGKMPRETKPKKAILVAVAAIIAVAAVGLILASGQKSDIGELPDSDNRQTNINAEETDKTSDKKPDEKLPEETDTDLNDYSEAPEEPEEGKSASLPLRPTWMPKGYDIISEEGEFGTIVYMNDTDTVTYTCSKQSEEFMCPVELNSHKVTVNGTAAQILVPVENKFGYVKKTLTMEKDGNFITITADLSEQELIKIAESVKISDN